MDFLERLKQDQALIESQLDAYTRFDAEILQKGVLEAMRYSLLGGGKRIRAFLTLEVCRSLGGQLQTAIPAACAVEMIHAYSLIHDDLPCMDNDDIRRGKPSCNKQFGDAVAVLAGDGLLTLAFETLSSEATMKAMGQNKAFECIRILSGASGAYGMLGGQTIDVLFENKVLDSLSHRTMVQMKTGALILASAKMGCVCADADAGVTDLIIDFAMASGEAFQITDDILDVRGNSAVLGKPVGSDEKLNKNTYVTAYGLFGAQNRAQILFMKARDTLNNLHLKNSYLPDFIDYLAKRNQ